MTRLSDVNEGINQALEGSVRGDAVPYEGISSPAVTRDCPNRGRDLSAHSSAAILDVADLAAGNAPVKDSPLVGNEGVGGTVEGHGDRVSVCETRQPVTPDVKSGRSEHQASPADSQISQGLTIERLIDSVSRAEEHAAEIEQLRAEEEAAAEEGALIEASNMPYPEYERNGR